MGTPVPEEWPELEPVKWYHIGSDAYAGLPSGIGCDSDYVGRFEGCRTGAFIQSWLDADSECVFGRFLLRVDLPERLLFIHGPYDTVGECNAARGA